MTTISKNTPVIYSIANEIAPVNKKKHPKNMN